MLALFQEFLRENGALAALMSGSGSTTFAIAENVAAAESLAEKFKSQFGQNCWTAVVRDLIEGTNEIGVPKGQPLQNRNSAFPSFASVLPF